MSSALDAATAAVKQGLLDRDATYELAIDQGPYVTLDGNFDPGDMAIDAIRAFIEHPDLVISEQCRETLRAHLEAK